MPPNSRRRPQIGSKKKSAVARQKPASSAVARSGDTKTAIQVHVHSGAQSGSRSGASAGARAQSKSTQARATRKTTIKSKTSSNVKKKPTPSANQLERVRQTVRGAIREEGARLKQSVREAMRKEAQSLTHKMGREARGTTQWTIKMELARVRAQERARKAAQAMQRQVRKATEAKKSAPIPTPSHVPVPTPTHTPTPVPAKPSAPAFPEGQFSRIRELPRNVGSRLSFTPTDAAMERAIQARNKALQSGELRFAKFETKKARVDRKLANQREKLERLKLKRGRAEAGATYAKGRIWGLRQIWSTFWNKRIERLDKRIIRTEARINGLVKLSANIQARYEQKRTEYLRRYPNPAQAGRQELARERAFMQVNLREQQTRMVRDVSTLKQNRLVFLELKERDPQVEQKMNRIEASIPRIENAGRAIRFEIIYRTLWSEIRRGDYSSALGWLSELEKLAILNQE